MQRRLGLWVVMMAGGLAAATVLGGCAGMRTLTSEVSTFGDWPAGRAPGRYAFERLPSQQARAADSDAQEASARAALAKAGFTPAAAGTEPDVLVQLGVGDNGVLLQLWDDPLWWRGSFGPGRYGPWLSPRWGGGFGFGPRFIGPGSERYEHQVALLIRDRASGKPLFEARAVSEGSSPARAETYSAMFEAALTDFPRLGINPRKVNVGLSP